MQQKTDDDDSGNDEPSDLPFPPFVPIAIQLLPLVGAAINGGVQQQQHADDDDEGEVEGEDVDQSDDQEEEQVGPRVAMRRGEEMEGIDLRAAERAAPLLAAQQPVNLGPPVKAPQALVPMVDRLAEQLSLLSTARPAGEASTASRLVHSLPPERNLKSNQFSFSIH